MGWQERVRREDVCRGRRRRQGGGQTSPTAGRRPTRRGRSRLFLLVSPNNAIGTYVTRSTRKRRVFQLKFLATRAQRHREFFDFLQSFFLAIIIFIIISRRRRSAKSLFVTRNRPAQLPRKHAIIIINIVFLLYAQYSILYIVIVHYCTTSSVFIVLAFRFGIFTRNESASQKYLRKQTSKKSK